MSEWYLEVEQIMRNAMHGREGWVIAPILKISDNEDRLWIRVVHKSRRVLDCTIMADAFADDSYRSYWKQELAKALDAIEKK